MRLYCLLGFRLSSMKNTLRLLGDSGYLENELIVARSKPKRWQERAEWRGTIGRIELGAGRELEL